MSLPALFVHEGDRYRATELALGPWYADALHGGPSAALLAHVLADSVTTSDPGRPLRLARITYELVRPVPLGPLEVRTTLVRPGRRITLIDGALFDGDGIEVMRARALLLAPSALDATPQAAPPFPGPEAGDTNDWHTHSPMFATHGMEIRFVVGRFREVGAATAWFRLRQPLIAGEGTHPLDRVAAAGDFGNGIATVLSWEEHTFINPDLTIYFEREPVDEWVALQSEMRVLQGSVAVAESVLWDRRGRIGRATQSLLVGAREHAVAPREAAT